MGFVFIISSLVILYSDDYIFGDLNIVRFILLVLMFVVSMMFLIISPNVISILLGWDGLGLVSYLLVIYYLYLREQEAVTVVREAGWAQGRVRNMSPSAGFDPPHSPGLVSRYTDWAIPTHIYHMIQSTLWSRT